MGKKQILIVEDDQNIAAMLQEVLNDNNFEALSVESGLEARKAIKASLPDLVITDLLLPGEHGIDLVKEIKDDYFIPVIIMTGIYKREELETVMEEYFVEGFFEKPLDYEKLVQKVKSILDE